MSGKRGRISITPPQDGQTGLVRVTRGRATEGIYSEIGELEDIARNKNFDTVLGYLGFRIQREFNRSSMTYPGPDEMAIRTSELNTRLRRVGESVVQIHPYDGKEMPVDDYLGLISQDKLPITTGRASSPGGLRQLFGLREFPHAELQLHDEVVHLVAHLGEAGEYRQERCDFVAESLERPDEVVPFNDSGFTITRRERAMRAVEEGLQIPSLGDKHPDTIWGIVAGSVLSVREWRTGVYRSAGDWQARQLERQQIMQRNQAYIATLAGVIRQDFPESGSAIAEAY